MKKENILPLWLRSGLRRMVMAILKKPVNTGILILVAIRWALGYIETEDLVQILTAISTLIGF